MVSHCRSSADFLMGWPKSLWAGKAALGGGNLSPYDDIRGSFKIGTSELSHSQRRRIISSAWFRSIVFSSHWGTICRLGEHILLLKNLIK